MLRIHLINHTIVLSFEQIQVHNQEVFTFSNLEKMTEKLKKERVRDLEKLVITC